MRGSNDRSVGKLASSAARRRQKAESAESESDTHIGTFRFSVRFSAAKAVRIKALAARMSKSHLRNCFAKRNVPLSCCENETIRLAILLLLLAIHSLIVLLRRARK